MFLFSGKYALLLHAMSKQCKPEEERSLREAEELVKFQLRHGNDLLTMDSIRDCDVNLKEQGNLLRQVLPVFHFAMLYGMVTANNNGFVLLKIFHFTYLLCP